MKTLYLLPICMLLFSCEKESKKTDDISKTTISVFAGIADSTMFHEILTPELVINFVWDKCGYGDGSKTIDLFNDGISDIQIKVRFLDSDLFWSSECCPPPMDCLPSDIEYTITSLNNIKFAFYQEKVYEFSFDFADTLNADYRIDTISNYCSQAYMWSLMYGYEHSGAWFFTKNDKFIAIRTGDSTNYKYGWIKIGSDEEHNLIFKEYSVQK